MGNTPPTASLEWTFWDSSSEEEGAEWISKQVLERTLPVVIGVAHRSDSKFMFPAVQIGARKNIIRPLQRFVESPNFLSYTFTDDVVLILLKHTQMTIAGDNIVHLIIQDPAASLFQMTPLPVSQRAALKTFQDTLGAAAEFNKLPAFLWNPTAGKENPEQEQEDNITHLSIEEEDSLP